MKSRLLTDAGKARLLVCHRSRQWAYAILSLLLAKTLWGIWAAKDFTGGDGLSYYESASRYWNQELLIVPGWSPLYQVYFGSFLWLSSDPFFAAIAHRIGILILITFILYEVMRRIVTPWIALLVAAWWIVLPINHNGLYEVHLFSIILPLLSVWVLARWNTQRARGVALAAMAASVFLLRPEYIIATVFLAVFCVIVEVSEKGNPGTRRCRRILIAYGPPMLVVALIAGAALARSKVPPQVLGDFLQDKRKMNVNQLYTYGYMHRNPAWNGDPWTDCDSLMVDTFGSDDIGLGEAFVANPKAMFEHVAWNLRNLPDGTALGLFSARAGSINIDYSGTRRDPIRVILSGLGFLYLIAAGIAGARRFPAEKRRSWVRERRGAIAGLASLAFASLFVLCLAPPRPAFISGWILTLMACAGVALQIVMYSWRGWPRMKRRLTLITALPLIFAPFYWKSEHPYQPVLAQVRVLESQREALTSGSLLPIAVSTSPDAVRTYLNLERSFDDRFFCVRALGAALVPGQTLDSLLRSKGVRSVLVADIVEHEPGIAEFESDSPENGWIKTNQILSHNHVIRVYRR